MNNLPAPESWRLKLTRAERHLIEIKTLLEPFSELRRYEVRVERKPRRKHKPAKWLYHLEVDVEVDPNIAVILGDFMFNVRSALDHMAVALAPSDRKGQASFPIFAIDPEVPNLSHEEGGRTRLNAWRRATKGMSPEAVQLLRDFQAFNNEAPEHLREALAQDHVLPLLSAFQNADKHRELVTVVQGLRLETLTVRTLKGEVISDGFEPIQPGNALNNGSLAHTSEDEAVVEAFGTIVVAVRDTGLREGKQAHRELPELCNETLIVAYSIAEKVEAFLNDA